MRKNAIVEPGTAWRKELSKRRVQWTQRDLDEVHRDIENYVYERALQGCSMAHLAREFGVKHAEFERVYGDLYKLAIGELQCRIRLDTLNYCLKSKQPVAKIWLGKAMGGLSEAGRTSIDVDEDESDGVTINVRTIRKGDVTPEEAADK